MFRSTSHRSVMLLLSLLITLALAACSSEPAAPAPTTAPEAPAVVADTPTSEPAAAVDTPTSEPAAAVDTPTSEPVAAAADTPAVAPEAPAAVAEASTRSFQIDQSQSEASFTLNEKLMGAPKTVVGTTALVSGTITVDLADMSKTTISPLQIDARDFTTDSTMRNGAIRRFVLESSKDEYRYITFTPTTIEGLPTAAKAGDTFALQVTGDLKIRDVVNPATFEVSVTVNSENELSGSAKTMITRAAYDLTIPSVPSVADVTDEVELALAFVAQAP